jgi:hypothetical protein
VAKRSRNLDTVGATPPSPANNGIVTNPSPSSASTEPDSSSPAEQENGKAACLGSPQQRKASAASGAGVPCSTTGDSSHRVKRRLVISPSTSPNNSRSVKAKTTEVASAQPQPDSTTSSSTASATDRSSSTLISHIQRSPISASPHIKPSLPSPIIQLPKAEPAVSSSLNQNNNYWLSVTASDTNKSASGWRPQSSNVKELIKNNSDNAVTKQEADCSFSSVSTKSSSTDQSILLM